MQENFNWFSISSQNNKFSDTSIQSFGGCIVLKSQIERKAEVGENLTFIGSFLDLFVVVGLLNEIQDSIC